MLINLLLATAFEILPFYEQKPNEDYYAVRPVYSTEGGVTDILWPLFTYHRDWWRFCYIVNYQDYPETQDGYQFSILPFWFQGRNRDGESYAGFFPFYGKHPHIAMMDDFSFVLWPIYHQYRKPRGREWLETKSVLFPFLSWRSDGAWSIWPFYGVNYQRESDHRYALWPLVTWASYREDRDTAGSGYSWMVFPFYASVEREREEQFSILPPFFSFAKTPQSYRWRCPWPLVTYERTPAKESFSLFPFYERTVNFNYREGKEVGHVTRFGWKLVEIYDDEVRVFPFYASGRNHFRLWPFWETEENAGLKHTRFLSLFPIRWVPAVDRNWAKFWTLYEATSSDEETKHSLFWGLIRWKTKND